MFCYRFIPKARGMNSIQSYSRISLRNFWSRRKKPPATKFSFVSPQTVAPQLDPSTIPSHVSLPPYYISGEPGPCPNTPEIKTEEQIQKMRNSCQLARRVLSEALKLVKPGTCTNQIDELVTQLSFDAGAYPSPLNYRGFPKSVCTSVNNVACHGIPDSRALLDGDIINVDVTVYHDGHHGDCSETVLVGHGQEDNVATHKLLQVGREALEVGIAQCAPGKQFNTIGAAVQKYVSSQGYNIIPAFTGHGIGSYFHGPPDIYCCRNSYPGVMSAGMVFTVEPIVSEGGPQVRILEDGWTAVSTDNSRSVQFEHTVLITENGVEILTN